MQQRVTVWLHPWTDERVYCAINGKLEYRQNCDSYQLVKSLYSIANGGYGGTGLGKGTFETVDGTPLIPYLNTDFVYSAIAQEIGLVGAAAVVLVIGRAVPGRPAPWAWGALAAAAFFAPYWLLGRFVGPELPTIGAALLGGLVFLAVVRLARSDRDGYEQGGQSVPSAPAMGLPRAAAPYLALISVVLVTRLVPPVRDALFEIVADWELFGAFTGSVRPLYHPGLLLPLAFAAGALAQRASGADIRRAVGDTNRMLLPVVVALIAMVTIARTMSQSGMTDELASAAAGVGVGWPLLAPAVGALGTFVTGSATASNILFTDFQEATAEEQGRPVLPLLGAQGFGAAVGNIICPHNVVAAAATVGLSRQEGDVLRRTLPLTVGYVALGGVLAWWFTR